MSRHVWETKTLTPQFVDEWLDGYQIAAAGGAPHAIAAVFAGYVMESNRQSGRAPLKYRWKSAVRSRHRYAHGKNVRHYLALAERCLALLPTEIDWRPNQMLPEDFYAR